MQPFKTFTGIVAPLDRPNVDTDSIIPKQYLKSIKRTGYGANLFDDWRYLDQGNPGDDHSKREINSKFILNQPCYQNAEILLTRENFGCGSSREHAVWALMEYGFRSVLAPSFSDIFYSNAFKNGLLPIVLNTGIVNQLFDDVLSTKSYALTIDLENLQIIFPDGKTISFDLDVKVQDKLLKGLDDIDLSMRYADHIKTYEESRAKEVPWLFKDISEHS